MRSAINIPNRSIRLATPLAVGFLRNQSPENPPQAVSLNKALDILRLSAFLILICASINHAQALPPFAVDAKTAPKPVKLLPATAMQLKMSPVTGGVPGNGQPLFAVEKESLVLQANAFAVGQSFVGLNLG